MIESAVFFLLGVLMATLFALLLAPVLGRRTARLVERRLRATMPITLSEMQAQKDLLRADFAVRIRKLEVKFEEINRLATERQIELGRREGAVRDLRRDLAAHRDFVSELEGEIEDLKGTIIRLEKQASEQSQALKEKQRTISTANDGLRERIAALDEMTALADSRKVEVIALTTQLDNLRDRVEDLRADLAVKAIESEERAAMIDELKQDIKARDRNGERLAARMARYRQINAARRRQLAEARAQTASSASHSEEAAGPARPLAIANGQAAELRESISALAARIVSRSAGTGDDEVRKLIAAVSAVQRMRKDGHEEAAGDQGEAGRRTPLAERIREADLQPGE